MASVVATSALSGCRGKPTPHQAPSAPTATVDPAVNDVAVVAQTPGVGAFVALGEVAGRRTAFVADEEEDAVVAVDLESKEVVARAPLGGTPGQLLLATDGTIVAVVRSTSSIAALRLVKGGTFREVARHATGHEPYGVAATEGKILVTSVGDARLETYAAAGLAPGPSVALRRDPRSVIVTASGKKAFVAHAVGSTTTAVDLTSPAALVARPISMDLAERRRDFGHSPSMKPMAPNLDFDGMPIPSKVFEPPPLKISMTRTATQGFALTMVDDEVLVPESLVLTGDKNVISGGYGSFEQSTLGSNVPYVARIGVVDEKPKATHFSGPSDRVCFEQEKARACKLPRAAVSDGDRAYVACLDSNEVLVTDPKVDVEHYDHACEKALRERRRVEVERPSGLAVDRRREEVVVFSTFTRKLTIAPSKRAGETVSFALPRTMAGPSEKVARGRTLFHETRDARISGDGRACASCHVDTREDGLVWPTPKGMRQTPMLAGRLDGTGPFGWNGEHATLPIHITATVANLGGKGLPADDLEALAAYLVTTRAPSRSAAPEAAIARGKEIFESSEAECGSCHAEKTHFTDGETHLLASGPPSGDPRSPSRGKDARFDTPSLRFVGMTAPYFHDGRYKTLEELVEKCDGTMGSTKQLSSNDRDALVAFLRTL
ncbi:MAG: hypothetical protein JST00_28525 [Deltaproteobacteria bacterium]|nr:hypothetical protein [Deltaproteobacteria bacterium]